MQGDCILRYVGTENTENIAFPKSAPVKVSSDILHRLNKLRVSDRSSSWSFDQCRLIAKLSGALQHKISERDFRDFDVGVGTFYYHFTVKERAAADFSKVIFWSRLKYEMTTTGWLRTLDPQIPFILAG